MSEREFPGLTQTAVSETRYMANGTIDEREARVVYNAQPGESVMIMRNGSVLVVHPENKPFLVNLDGTHEVVEPDVCEVLIVYGSREGFRPA